MVLVAAVGEVHAHHVEASLAELVDGLNRVRLGANGADDGGAAEVAGRLERGIELREPFDLAPQVEVVESCVDHVEGL